MKRDEAIKELTSHLVHWKRLKNEHIVPTDEGENAINALDMAIEALQDILQSDKYKKGFEDAKRAFLLEYARESEKVASDEAIQVVYCKDCANRDEPSCQIITSMYGISDYDYCSYGEKKE